LKRANAEGANREWRMANGFALALYSPLAIRYSPQAGAVL